MSTGLSAGLSIDSTDKPSIFELVASQSLDATFHPALQRVATVSFEELSFKVNKIIIY